MRRQRSRNHMKKQNRDPGKMESNNPIDTELKTLVIKMLNEIKGSVAELNKNFNKEIKNIKMEMEIIKGNQFEMKNILSEMRSIKWNKRRNKQVNLKKDQMPYLEHGKAKDSQSE